MRLYLIVWIKMKLIIFLGLFFGSTIGGAVPMLWGNYDFISPTSAFFSLIGSVVGLLAAIKIIDFFELQ